LPIKGHMDAGAFVADQYALDQYVKILAAGESLFVLAEYTHKDAFRYDGAGYIVGLAEHEFSDPDHLILPVYAGAKEVKGLGDYALQSSKVQSVKMTSETATLGVGAFANCDLLTEVELPSAYTVVDGMIYRGTVLHTLLASSDYVEIIFADPAKEQEPEANEGEEQEGEQEGEEPEVNPQPVVVPTGVITVVSSKQVGDALERTLTVSGMTSIGQAALYGNDNLRLVHLSSDITSVGVGAFTLCTALDEIEVSNDNLFYRYQDGALFNYTKSMLHTVLYKHVAGLSESLYNVTNGSTDSADEVVEIASRAFEGTLIARVSMPATLAFVGESAFAGMPNLEILYFESEVVNLNSAMDVDILGLNRGQYAKDNAVIAYGPCGSNPDDTQDYYVKYSNIFRYFIEMYFGELPDMTTMVKNTEWYTGSASSLPAVFRAWTAYGKFDYEYHVAETGERTATLLGLNAQAGAEIVVPFFAYLAGEGNEKVAYRIVELGADAFAGRTEITSLTLLYNVTSIQEGFLKGASNLEELIVKDNPSYTLTSTERHKGILFGNGGKTLMAYLPTSTAGAYSVPNGVTRIAAGAFAYSKNLQTLVIPQTVEYIGAGAFAAAGKMTTIECPYNKYYEFNNYALYAEDGTMLHTYLATGRGNSGVLTVGVKVQTINDFAFEGNGELYEIRLPEYQLTDSGKTTIS
ncbi:MAG: leucine-rich repeat protein, partial [Clostridia bacterium]|nr:leucine-rich repeat protein [Clostridia bacterium]